VHLDDKHPIAMLELEAQETPTPENWSERDHLLAQLIHESAPTPHSTFLLHFSLHAHDGLPAEAGEALRRLLGWDAVAVHDALMTPKDQKKGGRRPVVVQITNNMDIEEIRKQLRKVKNRNSAARSKKRKAEVGPATRMWIYLGTS
jgi:hypothetical protein